MKTLVGLFFLCLFAASSVRATVVSWNPDPNGTDGVADSSGPAFASPGASIAADYAAGWPSQIPLGLSLENREVGLAAFGIVEPAGDQWQENGYSPTHVSQFDVSSVLAGEFTDEKLHLGRFQASSDDAFVNWSSSTHGNSDVQIGEMNDSSSDLVFASIANFTNGTFSPAGALSTAGAPRAFAASLTPVPEMSALFPLIGLIAAIAATQILRRRRIAQQRAASPTTH